MKTASQSKAQQTLLEHNKVREMPKKVREDLFDRLDGVSLIISLYIPTSKKPTQLDLAKRAVDMARKIIGELK